jgi:hypothetical protein
MSAINRDMDRPRPPLPVLTANKTSAEVPLDYLVTALNRAVLRRQATGIEEIEHGT